jgi:PII-like signaling protein
MSISAIRVTVYINEADQWHHGPLHMEILRMLHKEGLAGGTVLHAVAGFTGKTGVQTTSLVDAGGKLPLVVEFIDTQANVDRVMPLLKEMAGHRLITSEELRIENAAAPALKQN